eukprot:3594866-Rhodomonas_salina.1
MHTLSMCHEYASRKLYLQYPGERVPPMYAYPYRVPGYPGTLVSSGYMYRVPTFGVSRPWDSALFDSHARYYPTRVADGTSWKAARYQIPRRDSYPDTPGTRGPGYHGKANICSCVCTRGGIPYPGGIPSTDPSVLAVPWVPLLLVVLVPG